MKAEDMPTVQSLIEDIEALLDKAVDVQQSKIDIEGGLRDQLAVQTATAQSLRLIVERAVEALSEYGEHKRNCARRPHYMLACDCGLDAFLAEIGARSAEAIQERKARRDDE